MLLFGKKMSSEPNDEWSDATKMPKEPEDDQINILITWKRLRRLLRLRLASDMAKEKEVNLFDYDEDSIKSLDWKEHIRLRPGMYIGKLGDGSSPDDGIYVLVKEVMDNCIDEYTMGHGKTVELTIEGKTVTVRDYGRGIPLGKVVDVVSKINTGAKYDSKAFQIHLV